MLQYLKWAHIIAAKMYKKMSVPSRLGLDDFKSFATIGLIDAAKKYRRSFGVKFMTYANRRIAGEIIDQIRADSWVPRLEMQTKDPEEIVQIQPLPMMTDDGDDENYCLLADTRFSPPDTELIDQEGWQLLIAPFRERTQRMLKMYYMDGMTMREIGNKLDISESRVCQKMGDAIKFLKESL